MANEDDWGWMVSVEFMTRICLDKLEANPLTVVGLQDSDEECLFEPHDKL